MKDVKLIKYIEEAINQYSLDKEINLVHIKKIIEEWKDKPLSKVLRVLMKDFDKYCCIFEYVQKKLYVNLNLQNFYGFDFYLDI